MRSTARSLVVGLVLTGLLGFVSPAAAVTYEDSFSNCNYPKVFDLIVMRPISFATMVVGAVMFVPFGGVAAATVPRDFPVVADGFVGAPARFTFKRRLGECQAIDLTL